MFRVILFAVLSVLAMPGFAQQDAPASTPSPVMLLPAKTPLILAFADEVSSKTAIKSGEVRFVVAEDLRIGDVLVVPKDTPAIGEVVHVQKSGFGGRGGELILAARYIRLGDQRIALRSLKPLAGPYAGKNNSDAALAVSMIPYAGLVSLFITGGEIVIPAGTRASVLVAADTPLPVISETK
jgi:hypothetical protein